jgi:type II secretory pathway pseudopilin PulG
MSSRRGVTLVEVLVMVGIFAVLIAVILSAVSKVREAAARARSLNNLRQLSLATHQVGATTGGFVGGFYDPDPPTLKEKVRLFELYPDFACPLALAYLTSNGRPLTGQKGPVAEGLQPLMVSPGDPSAELGQADVIRANHWFGGPTSYAFNMTAFVGPVKFPSGLSDGLSNTVAYCERYYVRFGPAPTMSDPTTGQLYAAKPASLLNFAFVDSKCQGKVYGNRRASFADPGWGDVVPVTDKATHVTRPSRPGATFQVQPRADEADLFIPQTPFVAGLPVALFDGSVRTVRPGVAPEVFWAAVTPAGGEVAGLE